jgi:hypothetical protein
VSNSKKEVKSLIDEVKGNNRFVVAKCEEKVVKK